MTGRMRVLASGGTGGKACYRIGWHRQECLLLLHRSAQAGMPVLLPALSGGGEIA